jgi:hypothetical protein
MRPLSVGYEVSQEEQVIMTGNLAGSKYIEQAKSIFSLDRSLNDYTFKLTEINGARGFQAIKPHCKVVVETDGTVVEADGPVDFMTLSEVTKIHIAIWDRTIRALAKKNTQFFKYELANTKYWLDTINHLLVTKSTIAKEALNNAVEKLTSTLAACGSLYCTSEQVNEIEMLNESSEKILSNTKQLIDEKLEPYDFGNEEETPEITDWLQLRTLINVALSTTEVIAD